MVGICAVDVADGGTVVVYRAVGGRLLGVDLSNGALHIRVLPPLREVQIPVRSRRLEEETSVDSTVATNCAALEGIDNVCCTCEVASH